MKPNPFLSGLKVSTEELKKNLLSIFENVSRFPDLLNVEEQPERRSEEEKRPKLQPWIISHLIFRKKP